ncbi:uncharacterized protein METZ01_LOCUS321900, partial [marine metagenome]
NQGRWSVQSNYRSTKPQHTQTKKEYFGVGSQMCGRISVRRPPFYRV